MTEVFVDDFFYRYIDKLSTNIPKERFRFILFGGEPLLPGNRGTIESILRYAKEHGIVVSTATNALTLPQMIDLAGPRNNASQTVD